MTQPAENSSPPGDAWIEKLAFLAATIASVGSVWLSVGLGLRACPLCFYQRAFAFGVAMVLGTGLLAGVRRGLLSLVALPLAAAGLAIAAYHVYLELGGRLECPWGILGIGTAPQQSLAALGVVFALLVAGARPSRTVTPTRGYALPAALALGLLAAAAGVISAPPMPAPPAKPYDAPPEICRPPHRAAVE